jgi:hypothetical protein
LQNPSQTNGNNQNNVGCKISRTYRNKAKEHLKEKINELETEQKYQRLTQRRR